MSGVMIGLAYGATFGVASGLTGGVIGGLVGGVMGGSSDNVMDGVPFGVAVAVIGSVAGRLSNVIAGDATSHMGRGLIGCLAGGVAFFVTGNVTDYVAGDGTFNASLASSLAGLVAMSIIAGLLLGFLVTPAVWLIQFRLITYPFDVVLAIATYYVGRRRPYVATRIWRWCPVAWNEVIWLPLPFVSSLLILLVRQEREEGFRQIAFVAAERKLQRRVAVAALVEVAVSDLKARSLSELSDISDKLGWTTDAPGGELPDELAKALPRFERVAQHAGQYLILNSAYRKMEALGRALDEMGVLQRSLIAARGRYAPRLLQVANEWRGLLEAERERVGALAEALREIPNPFVFGNPVVETEHNVFTGRGDIVRQIEANMLGAAQAPTLLLHGPRRMGKTSILNQLPRLLGPDFALAVVDCQNPAVTESRTTMLRYLSRACSEGLRRRHVRVEPLAASKLEREPFAVFDEWLDTVERAMPAGMRALLCLDEYERLQATLEAGWGGAFLDALRHTLQHRPRVVLMFTGAHTFQELGPEWTDRFISARRVRVSFLGREDVELLLTKPIPEFDMKYAPDALDAVVAATSCQPFLTQAVAFELVQYLNEQQRREATPEDVETAIARALVSGGEYFANVWSDAGAEGQAILRALAACETPPEFPAARAWLREHDVLDGEGRFAVEMMRRWVKGRA